VRLDGRVDQVGMRDGRHVAGTLKLRRDDVGQGLGEQPGQDRAEAGEWLPTK
jgi:hypothetical protein